jgi:hypothetical protein
MARTNLSSSPNPKSPFYISRKDPWDAEHDTLLERAPNAVCHSDTIYTGSIHKGFNADATAEELIRRYPPFQETEQHREFLVRSVSERHIIPGEKDDYFTPQQLWEEDDLVNGKKEFTRDDASSDASDWSEDKASDPVNGQEAEEPVVLAAVPKGRIGEEQLESDEQLALLLSDPVEDGQVVGVGRGPSSSKRPEDVEMTGDELAELFGEEPEEEQAPPVITVTTPEAEGAVETGKDPSLPITIDFDGHTTTITHDYLDVQRLLDSLDVSLEAKLTAITHTSADGSLVLAVLGRREVNSNEGSDREHPIRVDEIPSQPIPLTHSITTATKSAVPSHLKVENGGSADRHHGSTAGDSKSNSIVLLSGTQAYNTLLAETCWDPDTIFATTMSYSDGQVLVLLVGEQSEAKSSTTTAGNEQIDPAETFEAFFDLIDDHKDIPAEHAEIANLLKIARIDMIEAGALPSDRPLTRACNPVDDAFREVDTLDLDQQQRELVSTDHVHLSSQPQPSKQQVSGFPASFNDLPDSINRVAAPKPKPAPSKKRPREASEPDDEVDEDDAYIGRPQRKRKVPGRGRGRPRKPPIVQPPPTPGKKQAHKAMTAAESLQSIADVKARLAGFEADKARSSGSPDPPG